MFEILKSADSQRSTQLDQTPNSRAKTIIVPQIAMSPPRLMTAQNNCEMNFSEKAPSETHQKRMSLNLQKEHQYSDVKSTKAMELAPVKTMKTLECNKIISSHDVTPQHS